EVPALDTVQVHQVLDRWNGLLIGRGTGYVYPRTTNRILEAFLKDRGVAETDIRINYTPFGHADWQNIVADIKRFGAQGKPTAVISTINGDANVPFYRELSNQGVSSLDIPVMAFSVGEEELSGMETGPLVGHLAAWNYFMSVDTPENAEFIKRWHAFVEDQDRVTNDPMEAHYIGFNLWLKAVEKAQSTDPDAVIKAINGVRVPNLSGGVAEMLVNHHITKPVLIGEIQQDGQFLVVSESDDVIPGEAWSRHLPGSSDIIADWTAPIACGNYNTVTKTCSGQN
ncbi:MAG: transporter substrate-binding protein, partial [Chromatocurvus sp.]